MSMAGRRLFGGSGPTADGGLTPAALSPMVDVLTILLVAVLQGNHRDRIARSKAREPEVDELAQRAPVPREHPCTVVHEERLGSFERGHPVLTLDEEVPGRQPCAPRTLAAQSAVEESRIGDRPERAEMNRTLK